MKPILKDIKENFFLYISHPWEHINYLKCHVSGTEVSSGPEHPLAPEGQHWEGFLRGSRVGREVGSVFSSILIQGHSGHAAPEINGAEWCGWRSDGPQGRPRCSLGPEDVEPDTGSGDSTDRVSQGP